jgi:hypothetical protein
MKTTRAINKLESKLFQDMHKGGENKKGEPFFI